jgi:hypothetical protein
MKRPLLKLTKIDVAEAQLKAAVHRVSTTEEHVGRDLC